ncbi:selenocysteine-specific translation elongation factor [Marispirochaeta aestuarii]|uniref:Selenocysteine-specific translation elongation factor n=1 Tax=Marispirochaeta aestuarii TaxID=1963862 RepID=A0A1Y1S0Y9_9SPIO|nr:selenocysteine-specific translation elongation factor [Marispirochaeta aestuarii]ORC37004.1 selenocysteine-specific translation elongation factor [Marispirochaeta aestuarii]
MHIIGTAGHVDHGKTALIQALTGINADRLPEEKKRGMTIDLGFAHFETPEGEAVGVIDVPGHERFIRNMVAGAWSLSCAVLVVAGNEGWMQQTDDHARVLEAMGIGEVICALTKVDTIDDEFRELVSELVQENLVRIFRKEISIIPVSSLTGEGIDTLRAALVEVLRRMPASKTGGSAFFHVDRVFTIKGSGTVVTGSLAGGELSEGDEISILPGGLTAKIRGIQSYYSSLKTAYPVSRVACNLQGIKKEEVSRGCVAARDPADFSCEREFIIQWEALDESRRAIRNHMELEIASGTGHYIGTIHFLKTEGFARIVLNEKIPVGSFDPCLFIQQGGYHILGKGRFIWAGETDRHFRIRLAEILKDYPVPEAISDEAVLRFMLKGWFTYASGAQKRTIKQFAATRSLKTREVQSTVVLEDFLLKEADRLTRLCSKPGGAGKAEYLQSGDIPLEIKEYLIDRGLTTYRIVQKDRILISPEQLDGDYGLSPLAKKIMNMLEKQKNAGLQLKEIPDPGARSELRNLARMEKVVALEGDIYFSRESFDALARVILEGLDAGTSFSIPEAKEKTGLTRRYMIPFLNKMEEKGLVRRDGDSRVVC